MGYLVFGPPIVLMAAYIIVWIVYEAGCFFVSLVRNKVNKP